MSALGFKILSIKIILSSTQNFKFWLPIFTAESRSVPTLNLASTPLPFRFKAGGTGMALPEPHHHRSTTKTSHKPFKSRHLTKSALKDKAKGKIELEKGQRKSRHQTVMSKIERRNQAKQKRIQSEKSRRREISIFDGGRTPRVVAIVPLSQDVEGNEVVRSFVGAVELDGVDAKEEGFSRVYVERWKQRLGFVTVKRDLIAVMDVCRMADFVLFVLSSTEEVDPLGESMLRCVESQGISNSFVAVKGLEGIENAKKRANVLASLKSYITHFLPSTEKVNSLDSSQECLNVVRALCTTTPKGVRWREERSWMLVEDVRWLGGQAPADGNEQFGEVVVTGIVRGKGLKADRLLQVGDWGDFQISKITAAPLEVRRKAKGDLMAVDAGAQDSLLDEPSEEQDDLEELAPEEVVMGDVDEYAASAATTERRGVLLDDHHYFDDDETTEQRHMPKRLPRGTSRYQANWYLDDVDYSGSDMESVDENFFQDDHVQDDSSDLGSGVEDVDMGEPTEAGPSEYPQSEAFDDPSPEDEAEAIRTYRNARKNEAAEDLEFPDEIELYSNVLARERLARYRGLRSLKTSKWETEEDKPHEPAEWPRLLEVKDYKSAKNRMMSEALSGGVQPGTRVNVYLRNVPLQLQQRYTRGQPRAAYSLLRHEHKRTAIHFSITLNSEVAKPIQSKEELIMQCGPRRFIINPLFSQPGVTSNDVHKFNRYLHPGRTAIASFIAPLTWGSVPALFFRRTPTGLELIGTGTSLPPSQSRVIAKRIVLTGHPFKIHKQLVTVRYMFFNARDVAWFKALQLWTKRGRTGFIKEPLGTHGYFKATFDGRISPMDAVAVSLYKRVWPRWATVWRPWEE
jgi:pre-rRNA-processing protein TSR1